MQRKHASLEEYSVAEWVENGPQDQQEFREAVHTILVAIARDAKLQTTMVIKGGILLAIRYKSHRYTKDIDFSTTQKLNEIDPEQVRNALNSGLAETVEHLDYDLDCRVQRCKIQPAKWPNASFPELKMTVGYAYKGSQKHRRLLAGQSPTSIAIDYSINEPTPNLERFVVGADESLIAYSLTDLIAEKLRAVIQQTIRERIRRQDIFDLYLLIEKYLGMDSMERPKILNSLLEKAASRGLDVNIDSFKDNELKRRSAAEYPKLAQEVEGKLPDFELIFSVVKDFYESLPWE